MRDKQETTFTAPEQLLTWKTEDPDLGTFPVKIW